MMRFLRRFNRSLDTADFWLFEFSVWLHVVARSIVAVFIPVLLYQAGFSIKDIIIYYALFHAIDIPINFIAPPLIRKYGARLVFAMSALAAIAFFAVLSSVTAGDWVTLIVMAVFASIYDALYWNSHLFLFVQTNQLDKKSDKNTGVLFSVKSIAGIVGPAIGGALIIFSGQSTLLTVSIVLFILSLVPLIRVDDFSDRPIATRRSWKSFFSHRQDRKNYLSVALFGIHRAVEYIIWPLFIFVTLESIQAVALVPMIIAFTTIIFTYFLHHNTPGWRSIMVALGGLLLAFVWVFRLLVETEILIYFSMFLAGFFMLLVSIPLNADVFDRAIKTDPLTAMTYRNIASMTGRLFMFIFLAILVNIFEVSFVIASFSLLALATFNGLFLLKQSGTLEREFGVKHHYNLDEH